MLSEQDTERLRHIMRYADRIETYILGLSFEDFKSSSMVQDSVLHCLYVICEAAGRISDKSKKRLPEIYWDILRGIRNRLSHTYFNIDLAIIWKTVKEDLPEIAFLVKNTLEKGR